MASSDQGCNVRDIPDSCAEHGGFLTFSKQRYRGPIFSGAVLYFNLGQPRPSAANGFHFALRGIRHVNTCYTQEDMLHRRAIGLQQMAECVVDAFRAEGPSTFAAGRFGVSTVVVMPEETTKLVAPEGLLLRWELLARTADYTDKQRINRLLIVGQLLPA